MKVFGSERSERISPFRGIRYNQKIVGELAQVICPPYDVITSEQQKLYYEKSSYNAIRLEYPLADNCQMSARSCNNKYTKAATTFQQWLEQGVLQLDDYSAFYLHDCYFTYMGEKRRRRGLIARVRLEPWGSGIFPHEETASKAKDDRLQLIRACRANFSPLFALYQDLEQEVASLLAEVVKDGPIISLQLAEALSEVKGKRSNLPDSGESHDIWAITEPKLKQKLSQFLSTQALYVADGHHRYETALTYQRERTQTLPSITGEEAFNYTMMTLVEFSDPGLVILPIHRLVRGIAPAALTGLKSQLEKFFALEFVPLTEALSCHSEHSEEPRPFASIPDMVLGILGLQAGSLVVLRRRRDISLEAMMPGNYSQIYKRFDVSVLNHIILNKMLGFTAGNEEIAYTVDVTEAYQQIKEGKYQLAFLVSPPQPEIVKAVADAQDRMPRKSTYFYPKFPAGLIINPLD